MSRSPERSGLVAIGLLLLGFLIAYWAAVDALGRPDDVRAASVSAVVVGMLSGLAVSWILSRWFRRRRRPARRSVVWMVALSIALVLGLAAAVLRPTVADGLMAFAAGAVLGGGGRSLLSDLHAVESQDA